MSKKKKHVHIIMSLKEVKQRINDLVRYTATWNLLMPKIIDW